MISRSNTAKKNLLTWAFFNARVIALWSRIEKNSKKLVFNRSLSYKLGSERSEWASKRMSAAERASKASSAEQANEWAVGVNEQTDKWFLTNRNHDGWNCGCPGWSAARILHRPFDGVDTRVRCPRHERKPVRSHTLSLSLGFRHFNTCPGWRMNSWYEFMIECKGFIVHHL